MNFDFMKIKKEVAKTAIKAKKASANMVETAKYKFKLSEIKSDINEKYMQIGKLVYNSDEAEDIADKLQALCDEITSLKNSAQDIQATIDDMFNKKACSNCSTYVDKDFDFCPKCGNEISD